MVAKKNTKEKAETPLMKQYNQIKTKYPSAMLLFRVGDFYETFGEDAIKASQILGIVLTARNNGGSKLELAGFPHHSLDTYLPKLVRAGQRVAICDQLEDPKMTKKIVKRGVTELVTPGVSFNDNVLEQKSNNFLASVFFDKKNAGVAFLDISTGEFLTAEGTLDYIDKLLQSIRPTEIIYPKNKSKQFVALNNSNTYSFAIDEWVYTSDYTNELLLKHFNVKSLKGFGVDKLTLGTTAAGSVLHYLNETQHHQVGHISNIARIEQDKYVWLDRFTIRNLELLGSPNEGAKSFLQVLDATVSPMGSRLLKRWVALPLKNKFGIEERLNTVDFLLNNLEVSQSIEKNISQIGDLERLISKVAVARINPREVAQLKNALEVIQPIIDACKTSKSKELKLKVDKLNPCLEILQKITTELKAEPPVLVNKGNVIASGVNADLDELRKLAYSGKDYLLQLQQRETERTGISSLKIAFNNVFGYYLEVRNSHKDKVPKEWIRKQTLVNAERYITEELKEYEGKILGAEEKILAIETRLFNSLVAALADYIIPVQVNASIIGQLDCLLSFAKIAKQYNYTKPLIKEDKELNIQAGRHPVIEQQLPVGEAYIPNDVYLDDLSQQIIMITGPNMAGKSALLRQTALIVLMAQIGCFVPAKAADIGLVDKIFTRVGASDNITQGESTFMVEMNETASILNNISGRSLILLDEIGRGTSTYDGVSIAWAIAEYLHQSKHKPKTLFATHYHELNEMTNIHKRIKNFNVSVKELNNKIIFLRKLVKGGSEHSFGIHVAKMAGMPRTVLNKANEVLAELEKSHSRENLAHSASKTSGKPNGEMQLSFFQLDDPVLEQIKEDVLGIDINSLTPMEALIKLNEIKKLIGG